MARRLDGVLRQARYIAPVRTGRIHHHVLALLGIPADTLPAITPAHQSSEASWVPPAGGEPVATHLATHDVHDVLAKALTFLQWQLHARDGNLYLAAIDPVIQALPDPDTAWTTILTVLPTLTTTPITSITDLRRNDNGQLHPTPLPPHAEHHLNRTATPTHWLGTPLSPHHTPLWLLDERVTPTTLHTRPGRPSLPTPTARA
jgi:hypothetical protein